MKNRNRCRHIHSRIIQRPSPLLLSNHQEMADSMSPLPPPPTPPPPPPPALALAPSAPLKGGRIHHRRRRRHRGGFGFTDSDVAAAHQLIQLSDDSDEDKRRSAKGGGAVDREVTSARIEEIFGREGGDRRRDGLGQGRKKRYRSIAEIYAITEPIEFRRMGGHHMVR